MNYSLQCLAFLNDTQVESKIQSFLKLLSVSFLTLITLFEPSFAASYGYRTGVTDYEPLNSDEREMLVTLSVIGGGIYAWWYFSREKK